MTTKEQVIRTLAVLGALTLSGTVGTLSAASSQLPTETVTAEWRPVQLTEGRSLYLENCRACHGVLGAPTKQAAKKYPKIPDLTDATFWSARTDDSVMVVLRKGTGRDMKAFDGKLSESEMLAVTRYARTLARPR